MMKGELQNMLVLMSISGALILTYRTFQHMPYTAHCYQHSL